MTSLVPNSIDELIFHLRNKCNIKIEDDDEKQQLINYGYYHGYKGYRFFQNKNKPIPYTKFNEVITIIQYDSYIKSILYPELMFLETAIKNIVCNVVINDLESSTFDYVFSKRMNDQVGKSSLQSKRLRLKNTIYNAISKQYKNDIKKDKNKENVMVRHFLDRGQDLPLWVIFEFIMLNDLAEFVSCLNTEIKEEILKQLDMFDCSCDTNRDLLGISLYTIKNLRNAVAHNNVVYDVRFKSGKIAHSLKKWLEKETSIKNLNFYFLIDYIILISCLRKKIDGINNLNIIESYTNQQELLKNKISSEIIEMIIPTNESQKIEALKYYLKN